MDLVKKVDAGNVNKLDGAVKLCDFGSYCELKTQKRKFGETEPMDMDHQPSYAAQVKATENELGRKVQKNYPL